MTMTPCPRPGATAGPHPPSARRPDERARTAPAAGGRRRGLSAPGLLALITLAGAGNGTADIISLTGNLVLGVSSGNVCNLTANGLGVGTISPSANLHVQGNAVVGGALVAGGTGNASGSNLHIGGSLGFSLQTVTADTTLSGNSVVLADTSAGNIALVLPAASAAPGRIYQVKKTSSSYAVSVIGHVEALELLEMTTSSSGLPYLNVISASNAWYILGMSDGANTSNPIASANLVGWWKLDDTSGTTATDASRSAQHGTLVNGFTFSGNGLSGKLGRALDFDGVNDYVSVAHTSLPTGTNPRTLSVWFIAHKSASTYSGSTLASIVHLGTNAVGQLFALSHWNVGSKETIGMWGNTNNVYGAAAEFALNTWVHAAITYDSTTTRVYINGQEKLNGTPALNTANTGTLYIVNAPAYGWFDGVVDDVRLYNRALSAAEVLQLYTAGL